MLANTGADAQNSHQEQESDAEEVAQIAPRIAFFDTFYKLPDKEGTARHTQTTHNTDRHHTHSFFSVSVHTIRIYTKI